MTIDYLKCVIFLNTPSLPFSLAIPDSGNGELILWRRIYRLAQPVHLDALSAAEPVLSSVSPL